MTYAPPRSYRGQKSAGSYASIGLETEVLSATPEQLITLLMNGALAAIGKARLHMQANNIQGRGESISKAIDIVESGLKASVNREAGGELAANLVATYELIVRHLLLANLNSSLDSLTLAERLLTDISQAWKEATRTGIAADTNAA